MELNDEVERLFHELAQLTAEQRSHYFRAHPTDPRTRKSVEDLLSHDQAPETVLYELVHDQALSAFFESGAQAASALCGPYALLKLIGHGGMAEVWLAERTDGVLKRPVALKLPYIGFSGRHFAERSNRERDILAALTHPGIARLYDAGVADDGRPWLALEYIEGSTLSDYCDTLRLTLRARLLIFKQVLAAVQYAHTHLVIHRDLKPSNILVTPAGEVRLLDFGIAKLIAEGPAEMEVTETSSRALTLAYASPEQIEGRPVSTASDIYSLGVILFELLSGDRPFALKRDSRAVLEEAVLHAVPRRPSQAATEESASRRSVTLKKLTSSMRGDLDTIVLKALQKRPDQRYATVDALRADLDRYLEAKPVLAQPESRRYRARKFISRHKLAVLSAAAVFLALALGLGVALWQAQIARREARTAQAMQQFTEDIFQSNSRQQPDPVKARQTTARQLLEIGVRKIDSQLSSAPAAKLRMLEMLADLNQDLGLNDEAVALERKRVALAKATYGVHDNQVAAALIDLASDMHASRAVNEREKVLLEAQSILDRNHQDRSLLRALLLKAFAEHYESSDLRKSHDFAVQSVNLYRQWPPSIDLSEALYTQSSASLNLYDFAAAEAPITEAIALSRKFHGDPNPELPRYYASKSEAEESQFRFGPAEDSLRHALREAQALGGEQEVDTLETESRLGLLLSKTSRGREALTYLARAKDACIAARGAEDPFYLPVMLYQYGVGLAEFGRPEEALHYLSQAAANRRRNRPNTVFLAVMLEYEAGVLADLGRYPEAQAALDESLAISRRVGRKPEPSSLNAKLKLAVALQKPRDLADLVNRNYPKLPESNRPLSAALFRNLYQRAELALLEKDGDGGVRYSSRALQAVRSSPQRRYVKRWEARAELQQGRGYLLKQQPAKALALLRSAVSQDEELLDPASPELASAKAFLGNCYLDLGKRAEARQSLLQAKAIEHLHPRLSEYFTRPIRRLEMRLKSPAKKLQISS